MNDSDDYECTCGEWHNLFERCPTQGRTDAEVAMDEAPRCPKCGRIAYDECPHCYTDEEAYA